MGDLVEMNNRGQTTIVYFPRHGVDWIFLIEDDSVAANDLRVVHKNTLLDVMSNQKSSSSD